MARHNKAKARRQTHKNVAAKTHSAHGQQQLTMQQEARNTEGRNTWRTGSDFRYKAVQFVSAGSQGDEKGESNRNMQRHSIALDEDHRQDVEMNHQQVLQYPKITSREDIAHVGRANSEGTSEDEIVFSGRHRKGKLTQQSQEQTGLDTMMDYLVNANNIAKATKPLISDRHESVSSGLQRQGSPSEKSHSHATYEEHDFISLEPDGPSSRKGRSITSQNEEDDILADYIANIDGGYRNLYEELDVHLDLGSEGDDNHNDGQSSTTGSSGDSQSEDPGNEIIHEMIDFSNHKDASPGRRHKDHGFECEYCMEEGERLSYTDASKGKNLPHSTDTPTGSPQEPNQTDNIILHSGADIQRLSKSGRQTSRSVHTGRERCKPATQFIASASAFADALESDPFYGFDIMDFNRPSLRKKNKGKQPDFDLSLSDSELELEMRQVWQKDREKKKTRKQKREELRAQGLLGRTPDSPNLKLKYTNGIDINELKLETRKFLLSSKDSLALPPMAKQHRKIIHDMANALSLKSQSRGKGASRFPILYKTSRTPGYTQRTIIQVDKTLSSAKFNRRAPKSGEASYGRLAKPRGARPESSVSYMDGDVVGASAPAIGVGNKGRAMLEKMGWSSGTPLGALNNKGILLPVTHVVKNSKAGLG